MILIVIILFFFACIIAANSYLFQNALLWKMASCFCWFMDIVYDNYRVHLFVGKLKCFELKQYGCCNALCVLLNLYELFRIDMLILRYNFAIGEMIWGGFTPSE